METTRRQLGKALAGIFGAGAIGGTLEIAKAKTDGVIPEVVGNPGPLLKGSADWGTGEQRNLAALPASVPRSPKRMLAVYKPWALSEASVDELSRRLSRQGVLLTLVPTTDSGAPDIRFFDLDGITGESGVLEAVEAIKASIFDRKPLPDPDLHEIGMMVSRLVRNRLRHTPEYDPSFRRTGGIGPGGGAICRRIEHPDPMHEVVRVCRLDRLAHAAISPSVSELYTWEPERASKVYLEPAADHLARTLNSLNADFVTADLPLPSGVSSTAGVDFDGVATRVVRAYDCAYDQWLIRFDVLVATKGTEGQIDGSGIWGPSLWIVPPRHEAWNSSRRAA